MGSRIILNLVLAAVVIALALLSLTSNEEPKPEAELRVTNLAPEDIDSIHIKADGRAPISLERRNADWRITKPYEAPADGFRVKALLGLAVAVSDKGFRAAGNDLSQYGLDPPKAIVRFGDRALGFGVTDPVENLRYVKSGDQVYLLQDQWFSQVFGEAAAWLDPRPLKGAARLVALSLPGVHWQRGANGWRRSPQDPRGGADDGPILAKAWIQARALSVRAMDPAAPWSGRASIAVSKTQPPMVFDIAKTRDALLLGNAEMKVQYRFLPRQGDALLGRAGAAE